MWYLHRTNFPEVWNESLTSSFFEENVVISPDKYVLELTLICSCIEGNLLNVANVIDGREMGPVSIIFFSTKMVCSLCDFIEKL